MSSGVREVECSNIPVTMIEEISGDDSDNVKDEPVKESESKKAKHSEK